MPPPRFQVAVERRRRSASPGAGTIEHAILFEGVHVGERACLRNCIIGKYVTIPPGEQIGLDRDRDAARFTLSDNGGYRFA